MRYWTEESISSELDGHFYSLALKESGQAYVVDDYAPLPRVYRQWTDDEYQRLYNMRRAGLEAYEAAQKLGRDTHNVNVVWGRRLHWRNRVKEERRDHATLVEIATAVCAIAGIGRNDFKSARRAKKFCEARQLFYWLARRYNRQSFPVIGAYVGKDHSTVMHGIQKINSEIDRFRNQIDLCLFDLGLSVEEQKEQAA